MGLVAREEVRSSKHRLSKPEGSKRWRRPMYFNNLPLGQTAETKKPWGGPGNAGQETRAWTQPSGWQRGADSHADLNRRNGDGTGLFRTRITFFLHCLADTGASPTKESASILPWTRHGIARKGYISLAPSAESILGGCRALEVETRSRLRMTWCTSNN